MADITEFPAIPRIMENNGPTGSFTAKTAVKRGQVVGGEATGESRTVIPMVAGAGCRPVGVAIDDAAAGAKVSVALPGSIVTVVNADDTTGIDAFNLVETNDNAVGGTVSEVADADIAGAVGTSHPQVVGMALDDIAGGATGKILVTLGYYFQKNNA
jgi:hypothetical protein